MNFAEVGCTHLRFHKWATERVLAESLELPAEKLMQDLKSSFSGIYATLVHLFQSDSVWLDRLLDKPSGKPADYAAPGCTFELRDAWLEVQDKMIGFGEGLTERDWERELSYKTFAGVEFHTPSWQMILHIVNHGSYHRGQISAMLRQLGAKPVGLDLIAYYRSLADKPLSHEMARS